MPVYQLSELLAMRQHAVIPTGTPLLLKLNKKYMAMLKAGPKPVKPETVVTMRYSLFMSNNRYKRRYLAAHGRLPPKEAKSIKWIVIPRVTFLERYLSNLAKLELRIKNLVASLKAKAPPLWRIFKADVLPSAEDTVRVFSRSTEPRPGVAARKYKVNNRTFINIMGGKTLEVRPHEAHTKYWYFKRKRGYFKVSEHHPYGDEILYYGG